MRPLIVVALVAASGCLHVVRGDDGRVHELSPDLLASVPVAARYGDNLPPVDDASAMAELAEKLSARLPAGARENLVHDPRLDHLARVEATAYGEVEQVLSADLLTRLAWRLGVADAGVRAHALFSTQKGPGGAVDQFVDMVKPDLAGARRLRYGVGRIFWGKKTALALVFVDDDVELEPHAKTIEGSPSNMIALRGKLNNKPDGTRLWVLADGNARGVDVKVADDGSFTAEVPRGEKDGEQLVEIHDGLRSAALFAVYAGKVGEPAVPPSDAVGATKPAPDAMRAWVAKLGNHAPPSPELDAAAKSIAASADDADSAALVQKACGAPGTTFWTHLHGKTVEEMTWTAERTPSIVANVKKNTARLGLAVSDDATGVAIVGCGP